VEVSRHTLLAPRTPLPLPRAPAPTTTTPPRAAGCSTQHRRHGLLGGFSRSAHVLGGRSGPGSQYRQTDRRCRHRAAAVVLGLGTFLES